MTSKHRAQPPTRGPRVSRCHSTPSSLRKPGAITSFIGHETLQMFEVADNAATATKTHAPPIPRTSPAPLQSAYGVMMDDLVISLGCRSQHNDG